MIETAQMRVAPSVAHIPWVAVKFLPTEALSGERGMKLLQPRREQRKLGQLFDDAALAQPAVDAPL